MMQPGEVCGAILLGSSGEGQDQIGGGALSAF